MDRVQFYNLQGEILADTNILDLDQSVFSKSDLIIEEKIDKNTKVEETTFKNLLPTNQKKVMIVLKI